MYRVARVVSNLFPGWVKGQRLKDGVLLLLLRLLLRTGLPDGRRYKAITVMKKPIAKVAVSASNRVIWMDRRNQAPSGPGGTMCSTADSDT
ncbi:hypothetical protein BDP81DRAFT_204923 [Colletotrichum phormii]|uniref:Uncharacterized protein n=1 Tax=Colletotrichum phormii TaxID=359342 RepID=A0AAI9ZU59_9PEZI|nr:uncharacterized protein BDP81DRAFT_204923 [Colletotrichum phormii]KAK1638270.1 hypothetical protein BDP81DRAFT_204923 [Colletotrichum phormii]